MVIEAVTLARRVLSGQDGWTVLTRRYVVPIVTVQQSPRDIEVKRRLVAGITNAFVDAYALRAEQVQVFILEVNDENWAKAGTLAADASRT